MTLSFLGFYLILLAATVLLIRGSQFGHRLMFGKAFVAGMRSLVERLFPPRLRPRVSRLFDLWFAYWWHLVAALVIVGALLMGIGALV